MKKLACMLAAPFLLAAPLAVFAATQEEVQNLANSYYNDKAPAADILAQLAAVGADPSTDEATRCIALARKGGILSDEGRPDEAIPDLDKALELNPSSIVAYRIYGNVEAVRKNFKKAAEMYDMAVKNQSAAPNKDEKYLQDLTNTRNALQQASEAMSAEDFQAEFAENLFAAEEKYQGKQVCLIGEIDHIGRAMVGDGPEIMLSAGQMKNVVVDMNKSASSKVAKMKKGDKIMVFVTLKKAGAAITFTTGWIAPEQWYK